MKVLCVLGEHNYGDASRGLGYEYVNFLSALRNLGHDVTFFDAWERGTYGSFAELNAALLRQVEARKPEIILFLLVHYEVWRETLVWLRDHSGAVTINWMADDSWRYESFSRFLAPLFHLATTTYESALDKYRRDGIHNVLLTQWAASQSQLQPPLPASECEYQVTFVGTAHGSRPRMVAELARRGIHVACFGKGWPAGPVPQIEVQRIMRRSVISLNFANSNVVWDNGLVPRRVNQIKARVFEVPGAGGFLLTEYAPGLERWYHLEEEISAFDSIDELERRIRHYLAHTEIRDRVARAGFERTQSEHTYEMRFEQVLSAACRARASIGSGRPFSPGTSWQHEYAAWQTAHSAPYLGLVARELLTLGLGLVYGKQRGRRAARRLVFEASWRLCGAATYSASGWPGRLFYEVS